MKTTEERFWEKVRKGQGCWEWTAYKDRDGYGRFSLDGKRRMAHRVALMLEGIDIPSGMCVCHTCDNPSCVRPDHLFIGTHQDNVTDMMQKGRQVVVRGDELPHSKLTEEDIPLIREYLRYGCNHKYIASLFGVSRPTIGLINIGHTWSHI